MTSRLSALAFLFLAPVAGCQSGASGASGAAGGAVVHADSQIGAAATPVVLHLPTPTALAPVTAPVAAQRDLLRQSAVTAWAFVDRSLSPAGFVGATDTYPFATVWDMASTIAAARSARDLGIIPETRYHAVVDRALHTMETMPMYDGVAFNKLYAAENGGMVDRTPKASKTGYGWSAIDHGRLLVWLKVLATRDSSFAPRAQAIVNRLTAARFLENGYLMGEDLDAKTGKPERYEEGRVGYEQYAAEGFAQWGIRAERALDFGANGRPVAVGRDTVLSDVRGGDLLTSEPFVLMGLELGWTGPTWRPLSLAVLDAQAERYEKTGRITMVSEDAVPDPPAYFYYSLLYRDGKPFVVTDPSGTPGSDFPRWISTKAAFGYFALAPSDYTWKSVQAVQYAASKGRGWTAGVYEGTHNSTKVYNMNTAAVVLESAAYAARGCALVKPSC